MTEESPARVQEPPRRSRHFGRVAPFASGAIVALLAVVVVGLVFPGPPRLTKEDVDARLGEALASITPAPAFSELVYQAVRPSLVLIEIERPVASGAVQPDDGIGSGVVVNLAGDILTSCMSWPMPRTSG